MELQTDNGLNPFLTSDPNDICIACNTKLDKSIKSVSVHQTLPCIKPTITLFEGLKLLSNFVQLSVDGGPQRACHRCFLNADGYLRFQTICNTSVGYIQEYILHQEQAKIQDLLSQESHITSCEDADILDTVNFKECVEASDITCNDSNTEAITKLHQQSGAGTKRHKIQASNLPDKVECKTCHKMISRNYLRYHERIHTGVEHYKCKICGKGFITPNNIWSHMLHVHSDNKPHLCSICGLSFKRSTLLNVHIRVQHNNERPYECEICGKTFKTSSVRKLHYTTHSDERPVQCEKCPKRFANKKQLKQHAVTHAEVRPIECGFCDKRFTQKHCLISHQAKTCEGIHRR